MIPSNERYAVCMSLPHFSSSFCPFCMTTSVSSLRQSDCSTTMCDFFFCLLIKLPFHTLSSEHQIIHIFMSYLEACLHLTLELLQKSGVPVTKRSSTCRQHIPMVFLPLELLPCTGSMKCSNNSSTTSGVSCGVDARYARSAGRKIDTRTSASSSSDIRFFPS